MVTEGVRSETQSLELGVPQGFILGPLLFMLLYSAPVGIIARIHGLSVYLYHDDSELYLVFRSAKAEVPAVRVEQCVSNTKTWMTLHKLKMNDDETEILEIQAKWDTSSRVICHIRISEVSIPISAR